ncbi:MAG: hypothetical protein NTX57_19445 [Armatimonadetes bacterium]|nr:hypothetical protein [Armatimonadota bacterium]
MELLREIHAAARQKFASTAPEKLRDYGIGAHLGILSFVNFTGIAEAIYEKLDDEPLPGINAAKQAAFRAALDAYKNTDTRQNASRSTASGLRAQRDEALKAIKAARKTIQFAAEAQWPSSKPENKAAREAFQLPVSKPYVG